MKRRIDKYELIGPLGTGGMAVVYRAKDTSLERIVALKLMRQQLDGGETARKRFLNEARVLAGLQHSNIVFVYDFGIDDGLPYIVMEYLPGADLHELIQKRYPLQLEEKLKIAIQVAKGLRCAHGLGVVHRDIKPSNIRVLQDGVVKLMDFGIATILTQELERLTQTGAVLGSIRYMAPEQIHGRTVTPISDLFSFGAVLYELLTYRAAFLGDSLGSVVSKISNEEPPPIDDPDVPARLKALVHKCLRKTPEQRFSSVDALLKALGAVEEELWERAMQDGSTRAGQVLLSDATPLPLPEEQETVIMPPAESKDDTLQRPTRKDVVPWKKPTRKVHTPPLELVEEEVEEEEAPGRWGWAILVLVLAALVGGGWLVWNNQVDQPRGGQEIVVLQPVAGGRGKPAAAPIRSVEAQGQAVTGTPSTRLARAEATAKPLREPHPAESEDRSPAQSSDRSPASVPDTSAPSTVGTTAASTASAGDPAAAASGQSDAPAPVSRPTSSASSSSEAVSAASTSAEAPPTVQASTNAPAQPTEVAAGDRSIELWIATLHRRRGNERLNAARALAGAGRDAVEPLAGALRSPDVEVRMLAATALGQIGAPASAAVPALNEAAADPSALVRVWANYALARIDWRDPAALEALRRSQDDADEQVRQAATRALANLEHP